MVKMLNNVDLSDPSQVNSAINIVDTLVSGVEVTTKFANKYETTTTATTTRKIQPNTGTLLLLLKKQFQKLLVFLHAITAYKVDDGPTTTESNNETTSTTEAYEEVSKDEEAEKIYNLLKVAMALTDKKGLAEQLSPYDFEIRYVINDIHGQVTLI